MNKQLDFTIKKEQEFAKVLHKIGFYNQETKPGKENKDCAEMLFRLGYFNSVKP